MSAKPIDVYSASDYAGMTAGPWSFYYGYEWGYNAGRAEDAEEEWGFRASRNGAEVLSLSAVDLITRSGRRGLDRFEVDELLLLGIGLVLSEGDPA